MKNKVIVVFILIIFSIENGISQNLISNGNFKEINICAEYHEKCAPTSWRSTNQKLFGFIQKNGNNHIKLLMLRIGKSNQRKFAQTELLCPLEKDEIYEISMKVKANIFATKYICVGFSNSFEYDEHLDFSKIYANRKCVNIIESIKNGQWIDIKFQYKSVGTERFICIGNLKQDSETEYTVLDKKELKKLKKSYEPQGFIEYEIDDVVLEPINDQICNDFENRKRNVSKNKHRHSSNWKTYVKINTDSLFDVNQKIIKMDKNDNVLIKEIKLSSENEIVLKNLNFENNEYKLTVENISELDPIIREMQSNKFIKIKITGHTDLRGNKKDNKILSLKRAESVRDYIFQKGIEKRRMEVDGKGESEPIGINDNAINRRVVIKIL